MNGLPSMANFSTSNMHLARARHHVQGLAARIVPLLEYEAGKSIDDAVSPILEDLMDLRNKCSKKEEELFEARVSIRQMNADSEEQLNVVKQERDEARQERNKAREERYKAEQARDQARQERNKAKNERDKVKKERDEVKKERDEVKQNLEEHNECVAVITRDRNNVKESLAAVEGGQQLHDYFGRVNETALPVCSGLCNRCLKPVEEGKVGVLNECGAVSFRDQSCDPGADITLAFSCAARLVPCRT
jgi:chromosome segregation ATPase